MMGFGSYGNGSGGGSSLSSSSNLSPLAPPFFTVDWSVQKPLSTKLADFSEPSFNPSLSSSLHNWINSQAPDSFPEFDPMAAPNSYRYSAAQQTLPPHVSPLSPYASGSEDVFSYGTHSTNAMASNFVEANPYYPSYVSPPIPGIYDAFPPSNVHSFKGPSNNDTTPSLPSLPHSGSWAGGLWDGLPGWEQGKGLKLAGTSGSKEVNAATSSVYKDHLDFGAHASKDPNYCGETFHGGDLLSEKPIKYAISGQQDLKSVQEKSPTLMPSDYLKTPVSQSASVLPESCPLKPSLKLIDSRISKATCTGSYEEGMKYHGINPNNSVLSTKFAPGLIVVPPGVATCSSEPIQKKGSVKNGNGGSDMDFTNFVCAQHDWKEPFSSRSFGKKDQFHANQFCDHLERTDHVFAKNSSTAKELENDRSICMDALAHLFGATSGLQDSNICNDTLGSALDVDKTFIPSENSNKNLDHYIPHLDSPCWKGAPLPQYRPFDIPELATVQLTKKQEDSNSYNHQGPLNTDDAVKTSSLNSSEDSVAHKNKFLHNSLASPSDRPSTSSFSTRQYGLNDAMEVGSNLAKPNSNLVIQSSDDTGQRKCGIRPDKSVNEYNLNSSWIVQENIEEDKLPSENKHTPGSSVTGVGVNSFGASDCGSSHRLFCAIEDFISSPASLEDVPSKLTGMPDKETPPRISVPILVNAIHNLSDLLLNYCSTRSCELKEQNSLALNNVINNLSNCLLKINRQLSHKEEALLPLHATDQSVAGSAKLHGAPSVLNPQMSKVAAADVIGKFSKQNAKEVKIRHFVSADAEDVKNDNMTQAIKKVLIENFPDEEETQPQVLLYKNLWLEAEAALCSMTYMARFNRMKTEIEKGKLQMEEKSVDAESPSRSKLSPGSTAFANSEAVVKSSQAADSSVQDSGVKSPGSHMTDLMTGFKIQKNSLNSVEVGKSISCKESPETNMVGKSEPEAKVGNTPDFYANNSLSIDAENGSWSNVSSDLEKVDKLSTEKIKDSPTADIIQDFPVSTTANQSDDVDALLMARFNILKSRDENSSAITAEQQQMQEAPGPGFAGDIRHWSVFKLLPEKTNNDTAEEQNSEKMMQPVLEGDVVNYIGDELTVKEFYLQVKDDPVVQSRRTNMFGNQLSSSGIYDASSSDWEHV